MNVLGYVIFAAVVWFILGKLLRSKGVALGASRFFNIKWITAALVAGLAYVWGTLQDGFAFLGVF